jgi:hypothetical protein
VVDFNLLRVDASVQLYPGLAKPTIRLKAALFNRLLARRFEENTFYAIALRDYMSPRVAFAQLSDSQSATGFFEKCHLL